MGEKIKQFAARLALLVTKSFVYLWQQAKQKTPTWLRKAVRNFGRRVLYVILFLLSPFYQFYKRLKRIAVSIFENPAPWLVPLTHRYALHVLMLSIAAVAIVANLQPIASADAFGSNRLINIVSPPVEYFDTSGAAANETGQTGAAGPTQPTTTTTPLLSYDGTSVFQPYLPTTSASIAPRVSIEEYTIRNGDTLAGIAAKFRLQLSTILQVNNLTARSLIKPGQKLTILPTDGLLHIVKKGDTAASIAKRYQVAEDTVLTYNHIPNERAIIIGETLVIPGGTPAAATSPTPTPRPQPTQQPTYVNAPPPTETGTTFLWPTVSHQINQYFTWRHSGVDIHGVIGAPIYAADDGVVLEARWADGYGNMVLIKHANGLETRYGHSSKLLVTAGQHVARGQVIALIGSTGHSTGPHLHFEVEVGSKRLNPLAYTR